MTEALDNLRSEIRTWLAANTPRDWRRSASTHEAFVAQQRAWFAKLVAAGFAIPHWPERWPGGGRSLAEQKVIYEELARADAPRLLLTFVSTYHAFATLHECGSAAQQERYLPAILEGEIWCQGFSEPNAGSDLAAIKTRARLETRPDGDVYVIEGQKVWSTMAQYADRCLLLARTSSEGARQAGLTYLLMDMKSPGVTVRPIHQIQGDEEFAEIFLDNVEIPVVERVGEEGAGWAVAQATLASERGLTLMELAYRMRGSLFRIVDAIHEAGRAKDAGIQRDLGRVASDVDAVCALADAFLAKRMDGKEAAGDASVVKNAYSRALRAWADLGLRVAGPAAQYREAITYGELNSGNWMADFMNSYAWTIAGGSEEIQRNIIAERMLGMPREPKEWQL